MKAFISFASPDRPIAEEIQLALLGAEHEVFFDAASLPAGSDYNSRIREALAECDVFIYLLSPDSVGDGRYAHTELKLVKAKWPKPWGFVLPVRIRPVEYDKIDPYLAAVTILEPRGNIAAEVAAAIGDLPNLKGAKASEAERKVVDSLLLFLEDRRLITEEIGYQSHFPDHLRQSAEEIRRQTTTAIRELGRDSRLTPILQRIQKGARDFQEATEGAADGRRMHGGLTPHLPMGLEPYLRSLETYRMAITQAMMDAANVCDLELAESVLVAHEGAKTRLREADGATDSSPDNA